MIVLSNLKFRNWACFRGEHELALRPTQYAISARSTLDPDRSNWNGKSRFVGAIDWALWGRLPEDCARKADLITRGEKSVKVELALSDGHRIVRELTATTPERLWLFPPAGEPSMQDEAQEQIARLVGLSREDFLLTFVQQDAMDRLIKADP